MSTNTPLRIGFVGVGNMGQCAHLKNYAVLPECRVTALAELRPELGRRVAQRYGVAGVYTDHREMLAEESVDALVATQQFARHGVLIPELAEAGVPIFIEKPLAGAPEGGQRIIKALDANKTWMMVGYHKRSEPAIMYAKDLMNTLKQTGELGALQYIRILMAGGDWIAEGFNDLIMTDESLPELEYEAWPEGMDQATTAEYHRFTNFYVHQVNLMRHLMGEDYTLDYVDPSDKVLVMHSRSGVTGTLEMAVYGSTVEWKEEVLIGFEHGHIIISLPAPLAINRCGRIEIHRDPANGIAPETVCPTLPWVHAMRQQAINFLAAVRGERPPLCDAAEALKDLDIARDYIRLKLGK